MPLRALPTIHSDATDRPKKSSRPHINHLPGHHLRGLTRSHSHMKKNISLHQGRHQGHPQETQSSNLHLVLRPAMRRTNQHLHHMTPGWPFQTAVSSHHLPRSSKTHRPQLTLTGTTQLVDMPGSTRIPSGSLVNTTNRPSLESRMAMSSLQCHQLLDTWP